MGIRKNRVVVFGSVLATLASLVSSLPVSASNAPPTVVPEEPLPGHARPPIYYTQVPEPGRPVNPSRGHGGTTSVVYTPANITTAYNYGTFADGTGQVIAIVDAYGDPNIVNDVGNFTKKYGLVSARINIIYPDGTPTGTNSGWATETALDVEWAHAGAPNAVIDLIVAKDSSFQSLLDGVRRTDWSRLRLRLIDRAIFLGTVGHLLIALCVAARTGLSGAVTRGYITDTIAFCVLLGLLVVPRTTRPVRLALAGALYGMAWIAWSFWNPTAPSGTLVKAVFIGPPLAATNVTWFAFLPWASVYLVGTCLGEYKYLGSQHAKSLYASVAVMLIKIAAGAITLSLVIAAVGAVLQDHIGTHLDAVFYAMVSLFQKYPPGPVYLLFFGGIGVMLIGILLRVAHVWREHAVVQGLAELGQLSLIAYLLQFLLYFTGLTLLVAKTDLTPVGLWPVYFLTSVALLLLLVRMSRWAGLNGLCTVGLPSFRQRWPRIQMAMAALAFRIRLNGRAAKDQGRRAA